MKKLLIFLLITCLVTLASCGNNKESEAKQFKNELSEVEDQQKKVEDIMDNIHFQQLSHLSKTDTTDKNKKEFKALEKDMDNHLMPAFKSYEKKANALPTNSDKAKELKKDYLKTVERKKDKIDELHKFITLCNQSIEANEDILDYTKVFEKNRSQVEENIEKANNQDDADQLTSQLKENNENLKETAQKYLDDDSVTHPEKEIEAHILPLISTQIKEINQTNITDKNVNQARKSAIEMYYSLQNYYKTRVHTIKLDNQLSQMDVEQLPKKGKDINKLDDDFYNKLKKEMNSSN